MRIEEDFMKTDDVGTYLKELRLSHNLTQKELASRLHITHQAVSNWEKGKALPDISILSQLGDLYGVSIDNILLKEETKEQNRHIVRRRVFSVLGLIMSLTFISFFLHYQRHIITTIGFVMLTLILSILCSFIVKRRRNGIEYLIITGLLIIVFAIVFSSNPRFYLLNTTKMQYLTEEKEIYYPKEFDEMTDSVEYNYMFDLYTMIFTPGEENIDVFNLSNFQDEDYITIDTGGKKVYDLVKCQERIFFTSYDENIPGEFKLYEFDIETMTYDIIYESQEVLNLYAAFENLYLVSDPHLERETKIYQYFVDSDQMLEPIEVDYLIYGLAEYYVDYESYLILSVTNLQATDPVNKIVLADYSFTVHEIIYEEEVGLVHLLFHDYGTTLLGTEDGVVVFQEDSYDHIAKDYARWPEILSPDMIRIGETIYIEDYESAEYSLLYDVLYYDSEYYPQGARFLIYDEGTNNFYIIDNEIIGRLEIVPREIEEVLFQSGMRITFLIIGVFSYGYFFTLGHKKKSIHLKQKY